MNNVPEISPELFIWDSYLSKQGYSGVDLFENWFENWFEGTNLKVRSEFTVIGWCPSNRLRVRPRAIGKAILVEDSFGNKVWAHWTE